MANVVRISQEFGQRIHESSDLHNTEAGSALGNEFQGPCHEPQILDKSANNTLRHVKFGCNFASLPLEEQCRALTLERCTNLNHTRLENRSGEMEKSEINQDINQKIKTCVTCGVF